MSVALSIIGKRCTICGTRRTCQWRFGREDRLLYCNKHGLRVNSRKAEEVPPSTDNHDTYKVTYPPSDDEVRFALFLAIAIVIHDIPTSPTNHLAFSSGHRSGIGVSKEERQRHFPYTRTHIRVSASGYVFGDERRGRCDGDSG